jgi:hypothetical protein
MTTLADGVYCLCVMKDWKYKRAFVIQFQPETDFETGLCHGRVEHIASYNAMRFRSLEELLAFVTQVLTEARADEEHEREETA